MLEPDTAPARGEPGALRLRRSPPCSPASLAGAPEAIRLAVEYAGDAPTEERAYALGAQALLHNIDGRFADGLEAADPAIEAATAAGASTRSFWP